MATPIRQRKVHRRRVPDMFESTGAYIVHDITIVLQLRNGKLQLLTSTDGSSVDVHQVKSPYDVSDGTWHSISLEVSNKVCSLRTLQIPSVKCIYKT